MNSYLLSTLPADCSHMFLTYVELWDVEHLPPADHVFPLDGEFEGVCPLSGRDELWAQEPYKVENTCITHFERSVRKYACEAGCDGRSYSRRDAAVCVFSMMTGLGGGVNLGGCPLPPPAA